MTTEKSPSSRAEEQRIPSINKIGGANMSKLDQVKNLVECLQKEGEQPILVVSAFKGVTNLLINTLDKLHNTDFDEKSILSKLEPTQKSIFDVIDTHFTDDTKKKEAKKATDDILKTIIPELMEHKTSSGVFLRAGSEDKIRDRMIGLGEKTAVAVLKIFLNECGFNTSAIEGVEYTSENGSPHETSKELHENIQRGIIQKLKGRERDPSEILILGGYVDNMPNGMVADVGRSYTDAEAVNVGAAIQRVWGQVANVVLWKEVDGLMSMHPEDSNDINDPKHITHISHGEGLEISAAGSKLVFVDALYLATGLGLPLGVRNIENPHEPGTIYSRHEFSTEAPFKVINRHPHHFLRFECSAMIKEAGFIGALSALFRKHKINVNDCITDGKAICFTVPIPSDKSDQKFVKRSLDSLVQDIENFSIENEQYTLDADWKQGTYENITIVGAELAHQRGILAMMTRVLAAHGINIFAVVQTNAERRVSFYVHNNDSKLAVQALHAFFIDKNEDIREKVRVEFDEAFARFGV